jgi:hypothetical protein
MVQQPRFGAPGKAWATRMPLRSKPKLKPRTATQRVQVPSGQGGPPARSESRVVVRKYTGTHHRDYPKQITITRQCHPFDGKTLDLIAWTHRRGILQANAILPDATRAMIPPPWTDYTTAASTSQWSSPPSQLSATLASVSDVLRACTVVAPLLARIRSAAAACSRPLEVESHVPASELRTRAMALVPLCAPPRSVKLRSRVVSHGDVVTPRKTGRALRRHRERLRTH